MQPIQFLQTILLPNEFRAFCFGNEVKYMSRRNYKGSYEDDTRKALTYNYWRYLSLQGKTINPETDLPPLGYTYNALLAVTEGNKP